MSAATKSRRVFATRRDAAEMFGLTVQRVDELRRSGQIRAKKDGRAVLVDVSSLAEWAESLEDA